MSLHSIRTPAFPGRVFRGRNPIRWTALFACSLCLCLIAMGAVVQSYWKPRVWQRNSGSRVWTAASASGKIRVLYYSVLNHQAPAFFNVTPTGWSVGFFDASPARETKFGGTTSELRGVSVDVRLSDHWGFDWIWVDEPPSEEPGALTFPGQRVRSLAMPYWPLSAASSGVALLAARRLWAIRRLRRRMLLGQCSECGYDLRASAGRCPECGAPGPAPTERPGGPQPASGQSPIQTASTRAS